MEDDLVMLGHPGLELHLGHADQSVRQGRAALPPHGRPPAGLAVGAGGLAGVGAVLAVVAGGVVQRLVSVFHFGPACCRVCHVERLGQKWEHRFVCCLLGTAVVCVDEGQN